MAFFCDVDTVAVSTVALPSPHIFLPLLFPQAVALHRPILEISHVVFFSECQQAATVGFVVDKISEIGGSRGKAHEALSHFAVQTEPAFVDGMLCDEHAQTVSTAALHPSQINPVFSRLDLIPLLPHELR